MKKETQLNGSLLVRAKTSSESNLEPGADQVARAFSGGIVSSTDGQSDEDRLCLFGQGEDRLELPTAAKISAFFSISQVEMARWRLKLPRLKPPSTPARDRTEWRWGKRWIKVLRLSVSYRRVAIPLFWSVPEEKGGSADAERQAIIEQSLAESTADRSCFVSADREIASVQGLN